MKYVQKRKEVDATPWFKDGDHPQVHLRAAEIIFDKFDNYFYVNAVNMRASTWLAVDPDGPIAREHGASLPFSFYNVKSGKRVPVTEKPELLKIYSEHMGWTKAPVDHGYIEGEDGRQIVKPGDWIIYDNGKLSVKSNEDFLEEYEPA